MIGLLCLGALAAPAGGELRAWSDTAVELGPDLYGETGVRAVERLGFDAGVGEWSLHADGGLRLRRSPYDDARLDVYRLGVRRDTHRYSLSLGRHVRLDPRGFQRLDGASARFGEDAVQIEGWAGRLWHPELWATGTTAVAGGQVTLRPMVDGRPSRLASYTMGWEARLADAELRQRAHLAVSARHPRGEQASALLEVEPGSGARGQVMGTLPVGRTVDVGADLRWEDLRPATIPYGAATPIDWLSRGGYGVGTARVSWRSGAFALGGHAGPTVRADGAVGGLGRAGLSWSADSLRAGLFASGAGLGGSWLAGGGGSVGYVGAVQLDGDLGLYRYQGLDGGSAPIWEGRVQGRVPLREALAVAVQGAAGTDRQLAAWVRGGVALQARLEGPR